MTAMNKSTGKRRKSRDRLSIGEARGALDLLPPSRRVKARLVGVLPFGDALRAARLARGLTQEALAGLVGSTAVTINNTERHRSLPRLGLLIRLDDALGGTLQTHPLFQVRVRLGLQRAKALAERRERAAYRAGAQCIA